MYLKGCFCEHEYTRKLLELHSHGIAYVLQVESQLVALCLKNQPQMSLNLAHEHLAEDLQHYHFQLGQTCNQNGIEINFFQDTCTT